MRFRHLLPLSSCVLAVAAGSASFAQSPFTIRRPADGSTVREKVTVQIPRASIKPGGFIALYIDDKFVVAVPPLEDTTQPFVYTWDTKATGVSDGEHALKAILYEPSAGSGGQSAADYVAEKGASEVKLIVKNKITDGPRSLLLRYKYAEGQNLEYVRNARTVIVAGESTTGGSATADTEINSVRSKLLLGIEDARPAEDVNLLRNKLTELSFLSSGQEVTFDKSQLSGSMYQEVNAQGKVLYEVGGIAGLKEFAMTGIPVNNTIELPLLPATPVSVGQTWTARAERLDVPGLPPALQPRVSLESKFEGLEWEGNYKTAKIRQTFEGDLPKEMPYAGMTITKPKLKYERILYIGYDTGRLIKTVRTLTVAGETTDPIPGAGASTGEGSSFGGRSGASGGREGGPSAMGSASSSGRGGYPGQSGNGGRQGGGPPAGYGGGNPGQPGSGRGGYPGQPGGGGRQGGGPPPGQGGRGGYPGQPGGRGGYPSGGSGGRGGYPGAGQGGYDGSGASGGSGGASVPQGPSPVTVKATTETYLTSVSGR